jgi:dihydrofolate reductase
VATICATESVSLDGVMQGPGRPDEDDRGGFVDGGWADGYADDVAMQLMGEGMAETTGMLLGHRSYLDLLGQWTSAPEPNPFGEYFTRTPKWVASRSAETALDYPNSTLLAGEATETVALLKDQVDGQLTIIGSGELVRSLHAVGLVDRFFLQIHPIVLGSGQRLFDDTERADLQLERSATSTTGVLIAQYAAKGT